MIVSIFVKVYQIGYRSFFQDELYSVSAALEPNFDLFLNNWVLYDSNAPLYYFFLRLWLKIIPATEFWIRLPSVIFVLLASFILINGIKKRFNNDTWFYLLLFILTSYGFLFFAQEARAYGLLLLLISLQLLTFIDLLQCKKEENKSRFILLFTFFSLLASYTHYTGILFSCILYSILIFEFRSDLFFLKKILVSILLLLALGLLWMNNFLFFFHLDKSMIIHQKWAILKSIIPMLFFGYSIIGKYFSILMILIYFYSSFVLLKNFVLLKKVNKIIVKLGVFSFGVLFLSPFIPYLFSYRHYIFLIPIILLAFSILICSFFKISEYQKSILLLFGILIVVNQGFVHYKSDRENWRQTVDYVAENLKDKNTKVIIIGEPWESSPKEYLLKNRGDLNLSIRRKTYYLYYFNQLADNKKIDIVVLRPSNKIIEEYINKELLTNDKVFVLLYTGGFSKDINNLKINGIVDKKEFYGHVVFTCTKKY
ncbi:glycosyltransferase family 39 protein [Flavobacterium sp. J27]|uniref:glycosyltransferase family 39 protein n=1 Tax=Flavobacterium sp. J27 TaxID=2060419 RepID=UPI00197B02C2|nr:glycosyltransferase family 39 protein [Flavobacterium sp. J27]